MTPFKLHGRLRGLPLAALIVAGGWLAPAAHADELEAQAGWRRVDSRHCTVWLDPQVTAEELAHQLKSRTTGALAALPKIATVDEKLAARCDAIFERAQELLDMRPRDLHVTVRVARTPEQIQNVHAERYGFRAKNIAFYISENNTIYATTGQLTPPVLAHEMAHCIIEHYFETRPPRKIEELLAQYVDSRF